MFNHCCNCCNNVTNYAIPVYGKLNVNGNCVSLQVQSCHGWNGTDANSTTTNGGCGCGCQSGYVSGCGCQRNIGCGQSRNQGCNYGYFGCCRRRNLTTVVGATSTDGETDFFVNRCGSYNACGATTSRCGCCYNG